MQKHIYHKLLLLLFIAPFFAACKKNLGEYNLNPDAVGSVQPGYVFSNVLVNTSAMDMEPRTNYCHAYMQYGYSGFWSGTTYKSDDGIGSRYWSNFYGNTSTTSSVIKNLEYVISQVKDNPDLVNTYAAARIWRVFVYQKLTDFYGDIPYSQAGQALSQRIFTPVYDKQQDIYTDFIKELRAAIGQLNDGAKGVQGDQFYAGVPAQWKKLANSLLLRIGMRLIKVDPTQAAALVKEAANGGVMQSNSDMPVLLHNTNIPNGYYFNLNDQQFNLHKTLVDHMKATKDPRLAIYGATYDKQVKDGGHLVSRDTSLYIGYSFNASDPLATVYVSYEIFRPQATPFFDFHYAQVEFLLAEAVLRGFITGDANAHYQKGIAAHMTSLSQMPTAPTITQTQVDAYLAANPLTGTTEQQIEKVNTEFWVSGFLFDADEVWANWRRTGYPKLTPNPQGMMTTIPRKIPYPLEESSLNNINVTNALKAYNGVNNLSSRVWWDK